MAQTASIDPATMRRFGSVDERYQSYNVEMLEVTGGRCWKPYADGNKAPTQVTGGARSEAHTGNTPGGMSADLYQYRPPVDLANDRLRVMAKALGPAYVRISGTWANTTYFADTDTAPKNPPPGYDGVLTRQQWQGAIDFSRTVDARIVTSLPNSLGTRGADQVWRPDQALDPLILNREGLHVYAHCLRDSPRGIVVLVINNSRDRATSIAVPAGGERYTLASQQL